MRMGSFARMCVLVAAKWEVFVNNDRDFLKKGNYLLISQY